MLPSREPDVIKKYQLTNLINNNNKWWTIKWWKQEQLAEIQYGRVGQACVRPALKKDIGEKQFNKLIRDREKPKEEGTYKEIILATKPITKADTTGLPAKVVKRIETIFRAANDSIVGFLSVSLDTMSLDQIDAGKQQLLKILDAADKVKEKELIELVTAYYNLIPTKLSYKINASAVAKNLVDSGADEEDRLNQLAAAIKGQTIAEHGGSLLDQIGCTLTEVDSTVFNNLSSDFKKTLNGHSYNVVEAYELLNKIDRERYEKCGIDNIKRLYHGTKAEFARHILAQGLKLPKVGGYQRLFGHGIYFASQVAKSLGYISSFNNESYIFVNDVKMGKEMIVDKALYNGLTDSNYHSIYAQAGKRIDGVWRGSLNYEELIVFKEEQQTMKYLLVIR